MAVTGESEGNPYPGFTFYVVFGRYGGFGLKKDGDSIRLTLGWVGIAIMFFDMELMLGDVIKRVNQMQTDEAERELESSPVIS